MVITANELDIEFIIDIATNIATNNRQLHILSYGCVNLRAFN